VRNPHSRWRTDSRAAGYNHLMISRADTPAGPLQDGYRPVRGAHIYVDRGLYSHHGIDCGDGTVIDFAGQGEGKTTPVVRHVMLWEFAQGAPVRIRPYGPRYEPDDVVARAASTVGQSSYDLFFNNCEHFATWCVAGEHVSTQVDAVGSAVGIVGLGRLAARAGTDGVAGLGETAPRSASNVLSGLKTVGGSAAGGVAVVGGASAVLGAGSMMVVLRDRPYLTVDERTARHAGRVAGVGGAAAGFGAALHLVSALGVPGISASGLSSGLATLGSVAGGGMVTGVGMVATIPLLAGVVLALLAFGLMRWLNRPVLTPHPAASRIRLPAAVPLMIASTTSATAT